MGESMTESYTTRPRTVSIPRSLLLANNLISLTEQKGV